MKGLVLLLCFLLVHCEKVDVCSNQIPCVPYSFGPDICSSIYPDGVCSISGFCIHRSCSSYGEYDLPACAYGSCLHGQCLANSKEGEVCSSSGYTFPTCDRGLACQIPFGNSGGTCITPSKGATVGSECYTNLDYYPQSCAAGLAPYHDATGNCKCRYATTSNIFQATTLKIGDYCSPLDDPSPCPPLSFCNRQTNKCEAKRVPLPGCEIGCSQSNACLVGKCNETTSTCATAEDVPKLLSKGEKCNEDTACETGFCDRDGNSTCQDGCKGITCEANHFCRQGELPGQQVRIPACWPILDAWACDYATHYAKIKDNKLGWTCISKEAVGQHCEEDFWCSSGNCADSKCVSYSHDKIPEGGPCGQKNPTGSCDSSANLVCNYLTSECVPKNVATGQACSNWYYGSNCAQDSDTCSTLSSLCTPSETYGKPCEYDLDLMLSNCSVSETCVCESGKAVCRKTQAPIVSSGPNYHWNTNSPSLSKLICVTGTTTDKLNAFPDTLGGTALAPNYYADLNFLSNECVKNAENIQPFDLPEACKPFFARYLCCMACAEISPAIPYSAYGDVTTQGTLVFGNFKFSCNPPKLLGFADCNPVAPLTTMKAALDSLQCQSTSSVCKITLSLSSSVNDADLSTVAGKWLASQLGGVASQYSFSLNSIGNNQYVLNVLDLSPSQVKSITSTSSTQALNTMTQDSLSTTASITSTTFNSGNRLGWSSVVVLLLAFMVLFH